ncbi:hypothetical protein [Haloplasma contractile]|uniref:Uncharacterized protein n=1 Tax=Haloplasma contractile SSD-17B TaxID=1033810 RepID=U2DXX7_9MOLU|nr:hypothetical protein [Haloplasma contractile]ERJ13117.1 hypothetical protein HLPCO_000736 [Haloplasma contractile SSD-17B]
MISAGETFGDLKVVEYVGQKKSSSISKHESSHYLCECDCGKTIEVNEPSLVYKIVKNCGCSKFRKRTRSKSK